MCFFCVLFNMITILFFCILVVVLLLFFFHICFVIYMHIYNFYKYFLVCPKHVPKESGVCTICLEDVSNVPLECGHIFHNKCIDKWLEENDTCPNCRNQV